MLNTLVQNILQQIEQPKKDLEHNIKAIISETISKMDLVSQQEIQRQQQALINANQRLEALQKQVNELKQQIEQLKN